MSENYEQQSLECPECSGHGGIAGYLCITCGGKGYILYTPASDQPEYRTLAGPDVIRAGDSGRPINYKTNQPWSDPYLLFGWPVGSLASDFKHWEFRRPIAAEKREDTRTCGEISCDECNERYQKAIAEISALQRQLAQEMEAREKAETLIRHLPCHCGNFGPNLKCPCCQAKDAIQRWANEAAATSPFDTFFDEAEKRVGYWKERHAVAVERAKYLETDRDNLREALENGILYMSHMPACRSLAGAYPCNCGFAEMRSKVQAALHELSARAALQQSEGRAQC